MMVATLITLLQNFLRDLLAFADQFFPSPITLFQKKKYQFSPSNLPICDHDIIAIAASSSSSTSSSTSTQLLTTIDILSYNINNVAVFSPARIRRILFAIISSDADVILLQETNPRWEELLLACISIISNFPFRHFHHPGANDRAAGGIAVLSRYPLENEKILDFTKKDKDNSIVVDGSVFPALVCDVKVSIKKSDTDTHNNSGVIVTIPIANIHLRPPVELDGSARLDSARKTEPIRISEVKELIRRTTERLKLKRTSQSQPALSIIAGDFNEGDNAGALMHLKGLGYTDALQQYVPRSKETHTWPFKRNSWLLRKRLDHILWHDDDDDGDGTALETTTTTRKEGGVVESRVVTSSSSSLKCIGCGVMTGYEDGASDHQPVLSRFAIMRQK